MSSSIERIKQKADPEHLHQIGAKVPLRLLVAVEQLVQIERFLNPDEPKLKKQDIISTAIDAFISGHPLRDQVLAEVDMHFSRQQEYLERHLERTETAQD